MITPTELTSIVKETGLQAGFSAVGIATAEPLGKEFDKYMAWLQRGFHATLGYMDRNHEKRADPRLILPGAQSVIVVAQNYYTPAAHEQTAEHGKISRYSWGDDYHDVIPPKLEQICSAIRKHEPDAGCRYYTDTGPLLEKQWALRAGIGWQGKHSNIISRSFGSWFFLGVILTTAQLVPDTPIADFCGTCTACMDACPTGAIDSPYVVDAGRCISYWTIEAKPDVAIPPTIADNLEGWVFGCDICQDVCPWNRFQKPTDEPRFQPRHSQTSLEFQAIENMIQEDFSTRFRKSPVKRTKIAGLQRNARAAREGQAKENDL